MTAAASLPKSWPLEGRSGELSTLLAVVTANESRSALISGSAGVGKSRLVAELAERLLAIDVPTARVLGTRAGSSLPLGALVPLLGRPLRVDQVSLLDAAREALGALNARKGFVLVVDDAHLLDDVSAMVVHQIILRGDARVVVTVRLDEPTPDAITALWKDDLVVGVELASLNRATTVSLVQSVLGGALEGSTGEQLWKASQGNPMMLRELVRGAVEGDALRFDHGLWRLVKPLSATRRLMELVESRLGDLSVSQQECLELLALGEPLSAHTLTGMVGPEAPIELERRGLVVVETRESRVEVRLAHPLGCAPVTSGSAGRSSPQPPRRVCHGRGHAAPTGHAARCDLAPRMRRAAPARSRIDGGRRGPGLAGPSSGAPVGHDCRALHGT